MGTKKKEEVLLPSTRFHSIPSHLHSTSSYPFHSSLLPIHSPVFLLLIIYPLLLLTKMFAEFISKLVISRFFGCNGGRSKNELVCLIPHRHFPSCWSINKLSLKFVAVTHFDLFLALFQFRAVDHKFLLLKSLHNLCRNRVRKGAEKKER